jgi:prolyl 4-hydroxylase
MPLSNITIAYLSENMAFSEARFEFLAEIRQIAAGTFILGRCHKILMGGLAASRVWLVDFANVQDQALIMTKTTLASLPPEWQNWIRENLARACEPGSMADVMVRDGHFSRALATAAIAEAGQPELQVVPGLPAMPDIDTSTNTLQTPDRLVQILATYTKPRIVLLGNVVSAEECDALVRYSEQRLQRSPVVADADGSLQTDAQRTSQGAMLKRGETELIARLEARLAFLADWPLERGEPLQVVRYGPENEYRSHYDWFDPELPGPRRHLQHGGQRLATLLLYLNEVIEGGSTEFPLLGLEIRPQKGSAIFFANTDAHGHPDRQTLHAGMPVVQGVKFVANKWLRAETVVTT